MKINFYFLTLILFQIIKSKDFSVHFTRFVFSGIIIVLMLAISDTVKHFNEKQDVAIVTPAQQNMRTPSNQNPGQIPRDLQTSKIRNRQSDPAWSKNPNNNANTFDNFNRNRDRDNMRQYFDKESREKQDKLDMDFDRNRND